MMWFRSRYAWWGGGYTWCGRGHILLYIACCYFVTWSRSRYVIIPKSLQDSLECVLNRICSGLTRMCPSQNVFSYTMCSLVSHRQVFHSSKEAPRVCSLTRMRTRARICCLTKLCSLTKMCSLAKMCSRTRIVLLLKCVLWRQTVLLPECNVFSQWQKTCHHSKKAHGLGGSPDVAGGINTTLECVL